MTQADNIRPYALGVKYKILRDVREAVSYVIYINNYSPNSNLYYTQTKTRPQRSGFIIGFIKLFQL